MNYKIGPIKLISLFAFGLLSVITLGILISSFSAIAQSSPAPVSVTILRDISTLGLRANLTPIIPAGLGQSRNPNEGGRGTVGIVDNRVMMTSRRYPWSAIGRIESPAGTNQLDICTGSLVAPDIVLTNAHCVVNPETHQVKQNIRFRPNLRNGRSDDVANVIAVFYGTDFRGDSFIPNANDWAFAKLDQPLGQKYGTLTWTALSVSSLRRQYEGKLILAGYSADFPNNAPAQTAGVHDGCTVLGEIEGSLIHDCDTFGGSSGGPIMTLINDEFRIVGINSSESTESAQNPRNPDQTFTVGIGVVAGLRRETGLP